MTDKEAGPLMADLLDDILKPKKFSMTDPVMAAVGTPVPSKQSYFPATQAIGAGSFTATPSQSSSRYIDANGNDLGPQYDSRGNLQPLPRGAVGISGRSPTPSTSNYIGSTGANLGPQYSPTGQPLPLPSGAVGVRGTPAPQVATPPTPVTPSQFASNVARNVLGNYTPPQPQYEVSHRFGWGSAYR
jgi:hypothetical protein